MAILESAPKLDCTRDNQIFLCYKKWKSKIELIFRSELSTATPEEKTAYLKYWMGDEGLPLIEKWESTGKLDYSNAHATPTKEGGRSRPLSSGFKLETYWKLLEEEFKPKGNKLISIIELWTRSKQGSKTLNEWLTYVYNLVEACNYGDSSTTRHTTVEARNPRILLTSRIPVLLQVLQNQRGSAFDVVNLSAENT